MLSMMIVLSVVLAVWIGYKMKINVGIIGVVFAYIFGCFVLGLRPRDVLALWPTSLFFFIMMASFFYGIAVTNGTLGLLSEHVIYRFRGCPWLIPFVMWFTCFALSGLGPGPTTIFAFMPAILLEVADKIKMSKIVAAVIIVGGGVAGGYTPISLCYATVKNCLGAAGYAEAEAAAMLPNIALDVIAAQFMIFVIVYLLCKTWKAESLSDMQRPAAFQPKQKQTLALIGLGLLVMVLLPLLKTLIPSSAEIARINKSMEASFCFAVLLFIALLLRIGDQKAALNFIPWGTIILVCGTGMLVSVAHKAGAIAIISSWLGSSLSPLMTKVLVAIIAGIMSFFSSTLGVVAPTLIPLISGISASTGVAASALIGAIMTGGHFAGVSPFSTGGAMTMAGETEEEKKNRLFIQLIVLSLVSILFASLLTVLNVFR